jgi:hypothetical protein
MTEAGQTSVRPKLANPYLDAVTPYLMDDRLYGRVVDTYGMRDRQPINVEDMLDRHKLCGQYSWSIPDEPALQAIAEYGPILEMGAGTGYWAWLLRQMNVDVVAYDLHPPRPGGRNHWHPHHPTWTEVKRGGVPTIGKHQDRTLMLSWPPYASNFALRCLTTYTGPYLVYIGEGRHGCCGDDRFHALLEDDYHDDADAPYAWRRVRTVPLLQWYGMHDELVIYERCVS